MTVTTKSSKAPNRPIAHCTAPLMYAVYVFVWKMCSSYHTLAP